MLDELDRRMKQLAQAKDMTLVDLNGQKVAKGLMLQSAEIELCKQDILYFFRNYLYTDKNNSLYPANYPNVLPFIPYPFQEECVVEVWDSILKGEPVFIEKSRQMGISWLIMAIFVYGFIFYNHKYLVLSQKQDDVDKIGDMKSLFEKARFMIRNIPIWMLPKGFKRNEDCKYMNISRPDGTGSITGESANPNASRGGTYNAILPDEFAFQSNASTINKAMASASPCRIYTSTPNGKGCEHYRMKLLAERKVDKYGKDIPPAIKGLRYHRSDHPLYTQERYEKKTASMDKVTIAQELEINYNTAVVGRVYDDFPMDYSVVDYKPEKPLFVFLDHSHGGTDPHAIIIAQRDGTYYNLIDAMEFVCSVTDMAEILRCQAKIKLSDAQSEFYDRYKTYNRRMATFVGDPYDTHSTLNESTIYEEYKKVGIHMGIPELRDKKEQIMKVRSNIYRVRYNEYCMDMATALMNAKYPDRKEDSSSTSPNTKPIHDRTSHYRSCLEYGMVYLLENPESERGEQIPKDLRPKKDYLGRMVYPKN